MTSQPEGKLSAKIRQMALSRGAYLWKVHGNEYTPAGLPDLCGVYRGLFIGIESKMPGNSPTAIQVYRARRIQDAGGFVLSPCFTVIRAREFLNDIDDYLDGRRPDADYYMAREYGKSWSPE